MIGAYRQYIVTAVLIAAASINLAGNGRGAMAEDRFEKLAIAISQNGAIKLGAQRTDLPLKTMPADGSATLSMRIAATKPGQKLYLVLSGLQTYKPPEVRYQIYLSLPANAAPNPDGLYYVGSFDFFNAQTGNVGGPPRLYSYEVTDLLQSLLARKALIESVTIVPSGAPMAGVVPTVGEVALVRQ